MPWPAATDYSAAVQNPQAAFADADLAAGVAATDMLGLPLAWTGNFAAVFKLASGGKVWAVKCFTREVPDLRDRYDRISRHLRRTRRKFAVAFEYLPKGVCVRGSWYPALKMQWVEGLTLSEFLRDHAANAGAVERLIKLWTRLLAQMRADRLAHGDLQHGNILLVPGTKPGSWVLRLIDYDGMWVDPPPKPPGESGHPNYQHPQRLREGGYGPDIDRFAALVIHTALRAVAVGGKALWDKFDNDENLLFREADFKTPRSAKIFDALLALGDPRVSRLAEMLRRAAEGPLAEVPELSADEVPVYDAVAADGSDESLPVAELAADEDLPVAEPVETVTLPPMPLPRPAGDGSSPVPAWLNLPPPPPPPPPRGRRRWWFVALALLFAGGAAWAAWAVWPKARPPVAVPENHEPVAARPPVPPVPRRPPRFAAAPAAVEVVAGGAAYFSLPVAPEGDAGPWAVALEPAAGFSVESRYALRPPRLDVAVRARDDLPEGPTSVALVLTANGSPADRASMPLVVFRAMPGAAARLVLPATMELTEGRGGLLEVEVVRANYRGPVTLAVESAPTGVSGDPVVIASSRVKGAIKLAVRPANGGPPVGVLKLRAYAGEAEIGSAGVLLRVVR